MDPKEEIKVYMARMARTSNSDEKYRVLELINKLSAEDHGFGLVQKSRTLLYLNNHSEALEAAQQAIQECLQNNDQQMLLGAYVTEINANSRIKPEDTWKLIQKGEELLNSMSPEIRRQSAPEETYFWLVKANQLLWKGEYNKAIESFTASVDVGKTMALGESYSARWYWAYTNLSELYLNLGDLDKAHECIKNYLDGRDNDTADTVHAYPTANMGLILLEKGEFEEGGSYLEEALGIVLKSGEEEAITDIYSYLFELAMVQKDLDKAKLILGKLKDLSESYNENLTIQRDFTLANAILLKSSTDVRDRIKAQDMLIELVEKLDFYKSKKITAMKHLCDTYLDEIKLFGHEKAFFKAQSLIEQLGMIATEQNSMRFLVESYLLRARMKLINGEFNEAEALYDQAESICTEKNLKTLGDNVKVRRSEFEFDLKQMQNLLARNATLQERLKQSNVDDYLQTALHIIRR